MYSSTVQYVCYFMIIHFLWLHSIFLLWEVHFESALDDKRFLQEKSAVHVVWKYLEEILSYLNCNLKSTVFDK